MNEQTFVELSAGYALGALSPADEIAFLDARDQHPEWEHHVLHDLATSAQLADGVTEVVPPLDARSRVLANIARAASSRPAAGAVDVSTSPDSDAGSATDDTIVADRPARADAAAADDADDEELALTAHPVGSPETEQIQAIQRRSWVRGMFALVASLAVLVGIGWGVGALTESLRAPSAQSVLAQIEQSSDAAESTTQIEGGGQATVHWSESVGSAVVVADGLPELASDQTYEMWFIRDDTPISAGTFEASGAVVSVLLDGDMHAQDVVALTVEPDGGAPGGVPTGTPLFAVPTA